MNNISGKINLAALTHAIIEGKSGQKCIVIPITDNSLFFSEKGNIYLDIIAFPIKNPAEGTKDTHIVSQSIPKEKTAALKAQTPPAYPPTLGNLMVWSGAGEAEPNKVDVPLNTPVQDLPF